MMPCVTFSDGCVALEDVGVCGGSNFDEHQENKPNKEIRVGIL